MVLIWKGIWYWGLHGIPGIKQKKARLLLYVNI
jgi:hypothetical protein